jgi:hypothetical protein
MRASALRTRETASRRRARAACRRSGREDVPLRKADETELVDEQRPHGLSGNHERDQVAASSFGAVTIDPATENAPSSPPVQTTTASRRSDVPTGKDGHHRECEQSRSADARDPRPRASAA